MNETLTLLLSGAAGVALGLFFFGGLWWTIRKSLTSGRPALWILASFLLRTGVTLSGFYFVSGDHWERLAACMAGFLAARFVVTRLCQRLESDAAQTLNSETKEGHATQSG